MITHFIYEIVLSTGRRKVGCTKNIESRMRLYKSKGTCSVHAILEVLHDHTDQEAGDREWWWADRRECRRGKHYTESIEARRSGGRKGGLIGGPIVARQIHEKKTPEGKSILGVESARKIHLIKALDGKSATAVKAGHRVAESKGKGSDGKFVHAQNAGRLGGRIGGRRIAELGLSPFRRRTQCPHCGVEGNVGNHHRWHFDNCSHKPRVRFIRRAP